MKRTPVGEGLKEPKEMGNTTLPGSRRIFQVLVSKVVRGRATARPVVAWKSGAARADLPPSPNPGTDSPSVGEREVQPGCYDNVILLGALRWVRYVDIVELGLPA